MRQQPDTATLYLCIIAPVHSLSIERVVQRWCSEERTKNEYNLIKNHRLTFQYMHWCCDLIIMIIFFILSLLSFSLCRAVRRQVVHFISSGRSVGRAMSEGTTICATPTRIEQRAEKLSILKGVSRGGPLPITRISPKYTVFMCVPDLWPVKCNFSPDLLRHSGIDIAPRSTLHQCHRHRVRSHAGEHAGMMGFARRWVCVCVCVCVCFARDRRCMVDVNEKKLYDMGWHEASNRLGRMPSQRANKSKLALNETVHNNGIAHAHTHTHTQFLGFDIV